MTNLTLSIKRLSALKQLVFPALIFSNVFWVFGSSDLLAQTLTLFEDVEAPRGDSGSREGMRNSAGDIIAEPNFTLVGIARFGSHYSALINNGNQLNIRIDKTSRSMIPVPGYPGYQVVEVSSRQVSIRYPSERTCVTSKDKGISCSETNVATLRLTSAEPIKSVISNANQNTTEVALQVDQEGLEQNTSRNPFAALLEGAANSESSAEDTNSFTPRRINSEDVPPGMRVVSTPFGDRLVEE